VAELVDVSSWAGASELFVTLDQGVLATTRTGSALRRAIADTAREIAGGDATTALVLPAVIPSRIAERSDYLAGFPHLLGAVRAFAGARVDHLPLLRSVEEGADWSARLGPTGLVLAPTACHALYDLLADRSIAPQVAEVLAHCFRHEPSVDATRLQTFDMLEFVYVGTEQGAVQFAGDMVDKATAVLEALGLPAVRETATDPFFGVAAALRSAEQRESGAKTELLVDGPNGPFAVASVNRHSSHFGKIFGISVDDEPASSACVGFGLERLMLAIGASPSPRSREVLALTRDA